MTATEICRFVDDNIGRFNDLFDNCCDTASVGDEIIGLQRALLLMIDQTVDPHDRSRLILALKRLIFDVADIELRDMDMIRSLIDRNARLLGEAGSNLEDCELVSHLLITLIGDGWRRNQDAVRHKVLHIIDRWLAEDNFEDEHRLSIIRDIPLYFTLPVATLERITLATACVSAID